MEFWLLKRDLNGCSFWVRFGCLRTRGWPRGQRGFAPGCGVEVALHFHPLGILLAAVRQVSVRAEPSGDNGFKTGFVMDPCELPLPFAVYNGFFVRNLEMVVLGIGARVVSFPISGVITCV